MIVKNVQAHGGLLLNGQVDKPQDPAVWPAITKG